jgi:hypothetical protein
VSNEGVWLPGQYLRHYAVCERNAHALDEMIEDIRVRARQALKDGGSHDEVRIGLSFVSWESRPATLGPQKGPASVGETRDEGVGRESRD